MDTLVTKSQNFSSGSAFPMFDIFWRWSNKCVKKPCTAGIYDHHVLEAILSEALSLPLSSGRLKLSLKFSRIDRERRISAIMLTEVLCIHTHMERYKRLSSANNQEELRTFRLPWKKCIWLKEHIPRAAEKISSRSRLMVVLFWRHVECRFHEKPSRLFFRRVSSLLHLSILRYNSQPHVMMKNNMCCLVWG